MMTLRIIPLLAAVLLFKTTNTAPANEAAGSEKSVIGTQALDEQKDDLKTAASSGYAADRYSDWGRYPSGQGVTGYGSVDSRYNYGGFGGYDSTYGYNGYDGEYPRNGGYSGGNFGYGGYSGNSGYGGNAGSSGIGGGYKGGYSGGSGYGGAGGYGGYGGYSGNGGLNSYYGYSNPSYQGANHLGYGYYRRPGYGNIYSSGITPSLVTGYRGYSKK